MEGRLTGIYSQAIEKEMSRHFCGSLGALYSSDYISSAIREKLNLIYEEEKGQTSEYEAVYMIHG